MSDAIAAFEAAFLRLPTPEKIRTFLTISKLIADLNDQPKAKAKRSDKQDIAADEDVGANDDDIDKLAGAKGAFDNDLITIDQACILVGGGKPVSRPTIYRGIKQGRFPPVIHPSPGISRFRKSEVIAAIEAEIVRNTGQYRKPRASKGKRGRPRKTSKPESHAPP